MTNTTNTQVSTHNPVRSDVPAEQAEQAPQAEAAQAAPRGWALAGIGAAVLTMAAMGVGGAVNAVYDADINGDPAAILADMGDKAPAMTAFHVASSLGALLLAVFAAGLHRRLRQRLPQDSLIPGLASFGLLGTVVVLVLGAALDTEFIAAANDTEHVLPESLAMYNHWIGTVPCVWILAGISGLAMFAAARQGAVPRWLGVTGLVLGGLTVAVGASPLQYLVLMTGVLWVLITAIGFLAGDRDHRNA